MRESLEDVVELFELAQNTVFKLMASVSWSNLSLFACSHPIQDSVPKFIRNPQYATVLREHEFDLGGVQNRAFSPAPERTLSRSNTSRA